MIIVLSPYNAVCESQLWAPPTPPQDDNDVYMDQTLLFLYEPNAMAESQLPPVYVRKEHKKPRVETITSEFSCFYLSFLS